MTLKVAAPVCIILSLYLILLYSKKEYANKNHQSIVFIAVGIFYAIFWREEDIQNNLSFILFSVSLMAFVVILSSAKKTSLTECCYMYLAAYTVTEIWSLGTSWCCNGDKKMPTFVVMEHCLSSKLL